MPKDYSMPRFLSSEAPTWDGRGKSLPNYIWQLERLFEMCKITEPADKIRWLITYLDKDVREQWTLFPEFATNNYAGLVARLKKEYPEAQEAERGSLKRIKTICKEYSSIEMNDSESFLAFKRAFKYEATKLLKEPAVVSNRELVDLLCSTLSRDFQAALDTRLSLNGTTRNVGNDTLRNEDPYDWEEVMNKAEELTSSKTLFRSFNRDLGSSSGVATTGQVKTESSASQGQVAQEIASLQENVASLKDLFGVQEKNFKSWMESLTQSINNSSSMAYRTNPAPSQDRSKTCRYCGEVGHFLQDCLKKNKDIMAGRIKWDAQSKYLLFGDGSSIPMGDNPIIQRVDRHYQTKAVHYFGPTLQEPGVLDLSNLQANSVQFSQYVNSKRDTRDETIEKQMQRLRTQDEEIQEAKRLLELYKTVATQNVRRVATTQSETADPVKQLAAQMSALQEQFGKLITKRTNEGSSGQQGF
ncbi:hypothetical protein Agabi119p4_6045 [Agaricus bisporus var. burnettii]|uniref:CCHC-type domain-containing protein n=1 Tax=Agaricus bisporus var. burnettii TaxID=192524 RepID=A0A8H7KG64_AGABI|nr:hypothetical protein Agabi119p4_6045 [Agaricus bisporus var. burnettii]